jgi:hypothetical protein
VEEAVGIRIYRIKGWIRIAELKDLQDNQIINRPDSVNPI